MGRKGDHLFYLTHQIIKIYSSKSKGVGILGNSAPFHATSMFVRVSAIFVHIHMFLVNVGYISFTRSPTHLKLNEILAVGGPCSALNWRNLGQNNQIYITNIPTIHQGQNRIKQIGHMHTNNYGDGSNIAQIESSIIKASPKRPVFSRSQQN